MRKPNSGTRKPLPNGRIFRNNAQDLSRLELPLARTSRSRISVANIAGGTTKFMNSSALPFFLTNSARAPKKRRIEPTTKVEKSGLRVSVRWDSEDDSHCSRKTKNRRTAAT